MDKPPKKKKATPDELAEHSAYIATKEYIATVKRAANDNYIKGFLRAIAEEEQSK